MREEVIVHKEYFDRLGQLKYFQIEILRDTESIIGVEVGAIRQGSTETISPFRMPGDPDPVEEIFRIENADTIGRLSLQISATTDVFFQCEVRQSDVSSKWADFTLYPDVFGQWSHDRKRYETEVNVKNCSPLIEASFKDSWGRFEEKDVYYWLIIYIWIEKKI